VPPWQIPPFHNLARSFSLFALFFALASFVFNSLRALLQKHRGWGYPQAHSANSAPLRLGAIRFSSPFVFIIL
jgi:hypothetical protein